MRNTIIITVILFLAVIAASIFYFSNIDTADKSAAQQFAHIPDDAVLIASVQHNQATSQIFSGFELFEAIVGKEQSEQLAYFYQAFLNEETLRAYNNGEKPIILSVHIGETEKGLLATLRLDESVSTQQLFETLASLDTVYRVAWAEGISTLPYFSLVFPQMDTPLFLAVLDGTAIMSASETLLQRTLIPETSRIDKGLLEALASDEQENSPMKLFVVHGKLSSLSEALSQGPAGEYLKLLAHLSGYTALNMNFKSDALIYSGIGDIDTTTQYLSLFASQRPVDQRLKLLLPSNTASYMSFGISDYATFHEGLKGLFEKEKSLAGMHEQHRLLQNSSQVSVTDDLLPLWDSEFALLELANQERLGIIEVKDSLAFANTIQKISTSYPNEIYRLNHSNLLYYAFGEPLKAFSRPYFIQIRNYVVVANHTSILNTFAENLANQRTLGTTLGYIEFEELQANASNVSFFIHQQNARNSVTRKLYSEYRNNYRDTANYGYHNFYAWSVQLSGNAGGFFVNVYAKYQNRNKPGVTPEWTYHLNGRLAAPPQVFDYDDTSRFILAQSTNHILHAVNASGKKLWNAQLPGTVLGEAVQLSDGSIVLTTAKKLYRFEQDGTPKPGFSVELPSQATHHASVVEKEGTLWIFVPAGNRILVYNQDGKQWSGWENKTLEGNIQFDIKTANIADTSYVVAATDEGRAYVLGNNGNTIRSYKHDHPFSNPIGIFVDPGSASSSRIVATDTLGGINYFGVNTSVTEQNQGSWSANHLFDVRDVSRDSRPELIFIDYGELRVYPFADSTTVFSYDFGQDILDRPLFFTNGIHPLRMGVASRGNRLIYVFEENGTLISGFPTEGRAEFYFGPLHYDNRRYLLSTKGDNLLYAFRF